jgi:hypothetical protein
MRFPPKENLFDAMCQKNLFAQDSRPFVGMNPDLKTVPFLRQINLGAKPYLFDSDFECGNLDMAV